jgi:hypothetical protein
MRYKFALKIATLATATLGLAGSLSLAALAPPASATGTLTWSQLSPTTFPSARSGAAMADDPNLPAAPGQLVLYGGANSAGKSLGDTQIWSGSNWTAETPTSSPPALQGASMAYDAASHQLLLFGGSINGLNGTNGTYVWTGTTWNKLSPATSPPNRYNAVMAYDPNMNGGEVVLYGGEDASNQLGDTWAWNGTNWSDLSPTPNPGALQSASMTYDPVSGDLVFFGGVGSSGSVANTWL